MTRTRAVRPQFEVTTLDELFGGDGLDQRLVEEVEAARDGLEAQVVVSPTPLWGPGSYHVILVRLSWEDSPAGGCGFRWPEDEPRTLYWATVHFSPVLRHAGLLDVLAGRFYGFFHDELGIEEVWAEAPSGAALIACRSSGMLEVERPDGSVQWGGRTDEGRMYEHARWRRGQAEEPKWRATVA